MPKPNPGQFRSKEGPFHLQSTTQANDQILQYGKEVDTTKNAIAVLMHQLLYCDLVEEGGPLNSVSTEGHPVQQLHKSVSGPGTTN